MLKGLNRKHAALAAICLALIAAAWGVVSWGWKSSQVPSRYWYLREGVIPSEDTASARAELPFERISLERTECFGSCPVYSVVLHRSGLVEYTGKAHVERLGKWTGRIGVLELGRLSYLIEHERVLNKATSYSSGWTDVPTTTLSVWKAKGGNHVVIRDEGEVGPIGLWAVYTAIDMMVEKISWRPAER